jgi:class 3 adenylate cyclase
VDRKTARRYVDAAVAAGLDRDCGVEQLSDELIGAVVTAVRPDRPQGHGQAWEALSANHDRISTWVKDGLTVVKIGDLLARHGVIVPQRTLHRYCAERTDYRGRQGGTVPVVDGEPGVECQIDFARMGMLTDSVSGRTRVVHALIFTAVYSRHMFVWLTFSQTLEALIDGCAAARAGIVVMGDRGPHWAGPGPERSLDNGPAGVVTPYSWRGGIFRATDRRYRMTAATSCRTCGTELRLTAKFCDECGAPTASATTPAEYKQVTVLFADVVHSMDIAAVVGAERLREIMAELVTRAARVVQRYRGTVDKFTGDGIMAVFGAPAALEDHALRACLASLDIQNETQRLAGEVARRDGLDLQVRVGLNSGQVIAGEIGSGPLGYTAIGEQVGMAQRMESVAPPGGVMLTESTARLVENVATLGEREMVHIKGADEPVSVHRLLDVAAQRRTGPSLTTLVGRELEVHNISAVLDRSISGRGCAVGVVGPAGIGKTRLIGEAVELAKSHDVEVFSTFCESHSSDIPFHVVTRLLRNVFGISGLDDQAARARVRARVSDADQQDLLLLDDLLGIADAKLAQPSIDPDERRRRLSALINAASLGNIQPAVYVVEDAHWIDEVSESMLADFLSVIPQTPALVLVTYRPEYSGALAQAPNGQTIALAPLSHSETSELVRELVGTDPSVDEVITLIAGRAAGNPFFAQEEVVPV